MNNLKKISKFQMDILESSEVLAIYLIGSRATKVFRENSDYDFAVLIDQTKLKTFDENKVYDCVYDVLDSLIPLQKVKNPLGIDIIFLHKSPAYYTIHAIKDGIVIYDKDINKRKEFEELSILKYADFEPFRREQEKAILSFI
jgi:predicted nucleotidyltransferase